MAKVRVVETARLRPGKCAVSSDTQGPFLDTGKDVPRYGRVYLSVKWVKQRLHDAGHLDTEENTALREELKKVSDERRRLEKKSRDFDQLVEAVLPHIPVETPEPEVTEVEVARTPTDEEIEEWIKAKGANHPAIQRAKRVEKGSSQEWFSLYGHTPSTPQEVADSVQEEPIHPDEPMQHFSVHDQEVDLDEVLKLNVKDVLVFAEDKGEGFPAALARREVFVAEREGRAVRKGVLAPLGFWGEEGPEFPDHAQKAGYEAQEDEAPAGSVEESDRDEVVTFGDSEEGNEETVLPSSEVPEHLDETAAGGFNFSDDEDEVEDDEDGEEE